LLNFFYNGHEGRLRAFWRLLFQFVLYTLGVTILTSLALVGFILVNGPLLGDEVASSITSSPAFRVTGLIAASFATLASVWIAGRFFDRRPFSGLGLRLDKDWWLDLSFGLFLGAFLMTAIFLVELTAGWVEVTGAFEVVGPKRSFLLAILIPATLFFFVGIGEELFFRGYQLTNIAEGLNYSSLGPRGAVALAWVISSFLFGLLHSTNPGATFASTTNITFAGLMLGAGYVLTGRLGISIGLHITWNFFQGNVFGFPVSGIGTVGATFISVEQEGPLLLTGGPFGPEAGLLGLATMSAGGLLTWLWVRARSGKATLQTSIAEPSEGTKPASET
jgi:hypothetical protein